MSWEIQILLSLAAGILVGAATSVWLSMRPPIGADGRFSIAAVFALIALFAVALLTFRQRTMLWSSAVLIGAWSMFLFAASVAAVLDRKRRTFAAGFSIVGFGFLVPGFFRDNWFDQTFHLLPDTMRELFGSMLNQSDAEAFRRLVYAWFAVAMAFVGGLTALVCAKWHEPANQTAASSENKR